MGFFLKDKGHFPFLNVQKGGSFAPDDTPLATPLLPSINKVCSTIHKHNGASQKNQLYITICSNHVAHGYIKAIFGLCNSFQIYILILY